jgi:D-alanyl-D-alanine carboxypeptidase (penicillin-binding protein 5/6)
MKKFLVAFSVGLIVISGFLLFDAMSKNIAQEPRASQNHETTGLLPPAISGEDSAFTEDFETIEDVESISVDIMAANAYVLDVDSNRALYRQNSDERIAPASTAKMLTALTVLDHCSLGDTFTVGPEIDMIAPDSSRAWLEPGDTLTVKQLLDAMLMPSGNDAAYALAVNTGKRIAGEAVLSARQAVKVFVGEMNRKAKEIGAASSSFENPDGYDAHGQYTTACDLAQIAKACLNNGALSEIMGSRRISDTWPSGREVTYLNTNKLLDPESPYYYPHATGLKTGSSGAAGFCLVSAADINGCTYICVVMGDSEDGRFSDSLSVFEEIESKFMQGS